MIHRSQQDAPRPTIGPYIQYSLLQSVLFCIKLYCIVRKETEKQTKGDLKDKIFSVLFLSFFFLSRVVLFCSVIFRF
jgi:hypothetical protein